jgi:predicted component of type VI protein secretion system
MFFLRVESGPDKGRVFELREGINAIGRSPGNECKVTEECVSRKHCTITVTRSGAVLENMSQYGTLVDGKPAAGPVVLMAGMRLQLGQSTTGISVCARGEDVSSEKLEAVPKVLRQPVEERMLQGGKPTVEPVENPEPESGFAWPFLPRVASPAPGPDPIPRPQVSDTEDHEPGAEPDLESGIYLPNIKRDGSDTPQSGSLAIPLADLKEILDKMKPAEKPTRQAEEGDIEARCRQEARTYQFRIWGITWITVGVGILLALMVLWL